VFSYDPVDISLIKPRKRDYSKGKQEGAAAGASSGKQGPPQVPRGGEEQKPGDISGAVVWSQNKEKVNDPLRDTATRREQGKPIDQAGGKAE
jgi:hypothetical protein